VLAAADAVFDAERALRRAAETVDELSDVAASSLRVLDDAASDAFYAHQEERRDFYLESAGEHLGLLRNRSGVMNELGDDLTRHLTAASGAIERAGYELGRGTGVDDRDVEIRALRTQIDVLAEVVALARPLADQITRHAQHAADSAAATDALMLLDACPPRRPGGDPGRRGCVDDALGDRARAVAGADLSRTGRVAELRGHSRACRHVGGPGTRPASPGPAAVPRSRPTSQTSRATPASPSETPGERSTSWEIAPRLKPSSTPARRSG